MPDAIAWRPTCSPGALHQRVKLNARIRRFFDERGVLEVETPLLSRNTVTDPALQPFITRCNLPGQAASRELHLQTSPEFAMKRLLAAGSGSIYQICKAFRNEESGRYHNPEFTLLEWYRTGYSLFDLIDEIEALLAEIFRDGHGLLPPQRFTYGEIFSLHLGLDPLSATIPDFIDRAIQLGLPEAETLCGHDRTVWLDLLFSYFVQPNLGLKRVSCVYHYPAFMPSLAQNCPDDHRLVERVEIFLSGMELGNGFHELADADEQEVRFDNDREQRRSRRLPVPDKDERLLVALRAGLPDCSGVAIGLDRLLMVLMGSRSIDDVLAFPVDRA